MPRVTRSRSKKAKSHENSEIVDGKASQIEEVAVPADSADATELNLNENDHDGNSESDGDEAPESIPLIASKRAAIAEIQKEKESVEAIREKEKQRRRERDEFLKQQKELRKARELARLPAEILEKVVQKQKSVAKQQKEIKGINEPTHITFDSDDDNDAGDDDVKQEPVKEPKGLQVVVLNQASKNVKKGLDSASEFLKNHFYGDRLKRVGTLDDVNQKRKRKKLEPAIKFCKTAGNE